MTNFISSDTNSSNETSDFQINQIDKLEGYSIDNEVDTKLLSYITSTKDESKMDVLSSN